MPGPSLQSWCCVLSMEGLWGTELFRRVNDSRVNRCSARIPQYALEDGSPVAHSNLVTAPPFRHRAADRTIRGDVERQHFTPLRRNVSGCRRRWICYMGIKPRCLCRMGIDAHAADLL